MYKQFIPLNTNISPSTNPYAIRTYLDEGQRKIKAEWNVDECHPHKCEVPNSTISQVRTIEDQIRVLTRKPKISRFQSEFKKRCSQYDDVFQCVVPLRSPRDLKTQAIMRERYLLTQFDLQRRIHDGHNIMKQKDLTENLVELNSPIHSEEEEEQDAEEEAEKKKVRPKLGSPACSLDIIYMPSEKLLELKRPKSGMFHNETIAPFTSDIPYDTYNPRLLQEQLEDRQLKRYDIIEEKEGEGLWTWNLAKQRLELENLNKDIPSQEYDCKDEELALYHIPNDLDKTFTAEIVFANDAVRLEPPKRKPGFFNRPKEIACLFIAFVEAFRLNPDFWTAEIMDSVLESGDKLLKKSIAFNYKAKDMDFDIIPQITEKQASIGLRIHFTGPLKNEPNIYKALSLYFSKYNTAILCSQNLYMLIWKRCQNSYYIFDPNGRNELCGRDFGHGKCSLMATRFVEHLVHLITYYSETDLESDFHLYEIYLKEYGKIVQPFPKTPFAKQTRKLWAVVNEFFAIIPGANNGLQQPFTSNELNASMIISLLAILYANIERASLWNMEVVDELIKFGQTYYNKFTKKQKLKKKQQVNIADIPEIVVLGVYRATLHKRPFFYTGQVADCKNFLDSQLTAALKELFSSEWEAVLLQIDNMVLAIWRDREYIYIFDPFRRGRAGQVLDPEDYLTKGVACLQMHSSFDSLSRILYQKALKMRRGGKFFLHGINIGCIKPLFNAISFKNKFTRLHLSLPNSSNELDKKDTSKKKNKKIGGKLSIQSIPETDLIPSHEEMDIVDIVLEQVLCEILQSMQEQKQQRPDLYKCAKKVLLRSDKDYLQLLRYKVYHSGNYYSELQTQPDVPVQPLTLEDELLLPSNYETLPDGSGVVFSTLQLPLIDDETSKLGGLLSPLLAAALSVKYNISTWNTELLDFILSSVHCLEDLYPNYENALNAIISNNISKICIGHNIYKISNEKFIRSSLTRSLRQILLDSLLDHNRLLLICQRFSCVIVKRYNFLYMFVGFPCNTIGYRKYSSGPACMLRFIELDSLIRRIEFGCNPQGCEVTNYVAIAIKAVDVTDEPPEIYKKLPVSDEEVLYAKELEHKKDLKRRKLEKIQFLDDELRKENERINNYLKEKENEGKRGHRSKKDSYTPTYDEEEEEAEEEGEENLEEELKHRPGKKLQREKIKRFEVRPILYGYRMREKDCLFKIQGSTANDGRLESYLEQIKPCFFASTIAILYAILRPLSQWTTQRVDRVIEGAKALSSKITNMTTSYERIIKKIIVDDYQFDVWVKSFEPPGVWSASVNRKILKATQLRHYLLLQTSNCTYAIFRDEFLHLFDPYPSMELAQNDEGDEGEEKVKCTKSLKRFGERNTASWILFVDIESMLGYIDKRSVNADWKELGEFQFHVVDVLTFKKAPHSTRILQLLTDISLPIKCDSENMNAICAHNESLCWLDSEYSLPIWSRLNNYNASGRRRNLPISKLKKFDIEIDERLWSLWGTLHPQAAVFGTISRGKQYLACNVIACCAAKLYPLKDWSSQLLDTIVVCGDKYLCESLENIKQKDYEFSLEDLNIECALENIKFVVHLEHVVYGKLYATPTRINMNLANALMFFFNNYQYGILQCLTRSLMIGRNEAGFIMFDCMSRDNPLFPKGQGASYVLFTNQLQILLYCIVVTLNVPYYNVQFTLHKVEMLQEGVSIENEEEENENAD